MKEVILDGLAKHVDDGTIQTWFFEEGDAIHEGDDLVELSTEEGTVTVASPVAGILTEVYYDEGDVVAKGETLCTIEDDEDKKLEADDDEEDDADDEEDDDEEDDEDDEEEDEAGEDKD